MKNKIMELINNLTPELNELSLEIYNNPELGYEEFKACKLHTDILRKHGFNVQDNFSGVKTGFKAEYKSASWRDQLVCAAHLGGSYWQWSCSMARMAECRPGT